MTAIYFIPTDGLHQLESVLQLVQAQGVQPLPRGHLLRQHRPRLGRHLLGESDIECGVIETAPFLRGMILI